MKNLFLAFYLALKEVLRNRGRFFLVSLVIALISLLVLFIARALIHNPTVVLADEPTASLDTERAYQVVETFANLIHENNRAGIIVTHDLRMCQYVDRVLQMQDGKLVQIYETRDEILELAMGTVMQP